MRFVFPVIGVLVLGCGSESGTRTEHQLTAAQCERKMELLKTGDLLSDPSVLVGRAEVDESELLSLAKYEWVKGEERRYGLTVPRHGRAADYDGPPDEGDGVLMLYSVEGIIVEAKYVVAEY